MKNKRLKITEKDFLSSFLIFKTAIIFIVLFPKISFGSYYLSATTYIFKEQISTIMYSYANLPINTSLDIKGFVMDAYNALEIDNSFAIGKSIFNGAILSEIEILTDRASSTKLGVKNFYYNFNTYVSPANLYAHKGIMPYLGIGASRSVDSLLTNTLELSEQEISEIANASTLDKIKMIYQFTKKNFYIRPSSYKLIVGLNFKLCSVLPFSLFIDYRSNIVQKKLQSEGVDCKKINQFVVGIRTT